jgi:predicted dehydrogenase
MIKVGVIGFGYWGPNLVRNFMSNSTTTVVAVADRDEAKLKRVGALYPGVSLVTDAQGLIDDPMVDAVVIATPVHTHFDLALAALRAGKHVLVEKPIASSAEQAQILIDEAEVRKLVLMVDHTFVYTGAVRKMRELIDTEEFGAVRYYDSTRVNLGLFQPDVNVLWDLAVHDLSIMNYIIDQEPRMVSATGMAQATGQQEYVSFLTVYFDSVIAHINVNWLSPVKIRRTLVGGSSQMIVYDDLETSEKIKLYDKGIQITETDDDVRKLLISYRTGDLWSPKVSDAEALAVEAAHFAACIEGTETPITSGQDGLKLVRILEAANGSLAGHGAPITL